LVLATLTGLASVRYLYGDSAVPPPLRENFRSNYWLFIIHICLGSLALVLGPWQFSRKLRARQLQLHRWIGRVYVAACIVGGFAGLAIAPGSNGGAVAAAGFSVLAVLWITTTFIAYLAARRGDIAAHRGWMVLSFALTFAGVTLRLYLPLALIQLEHFSQVYAVIAWACWVPNLLVGYWIARR
jgi:uncharacterized membrane protein